MQLQHPILEISIIIVPAHVGDGITFADTIILSVLSAQATHPLGYEYCQTIHLCSRVYDKADKVDKVYLVEIVDFRYFLTAFDDFTKN